VDAHGQRRRVYGGDFSHVNNAPQRGLVRMVAKAIAPNEEGPRIAGAAFDPDAGSAANGTAQIGRKGNDDQDNRTLVYRQYREGVTTPVTAPFGELPAMGFVGAGLSPGSTQGYRIVATGPLGNVPRSTWVSVTISGTSVPDQAPTARRRRAPAPRPESAR